MCALGAADTPHLGRGTGLAILISVAGMVACLGLLLAITYINRPRFLVPPHLRGDPGAIAGRRRRRREHLPLM
jgi:hypothetical protein